MPHEAAQKRVLLSFGGKSDVFRTALPLARELSDRGYHPVILSFGPKDEELIQEEGWSMEKADATLLHGWRKFHKAMTRLPLMSVPMRIAYLYILRSEARRLVKKTGIVAALVSGDVGLDHEYFIAATVPTVVPQVSFDAGSVDAAKTYAKFMPFPATRSERIAALLLPPVILHRFPLFGTDRTSAWGSVTRTLGLMLLGTPMHCVRKGGGMCKKLCINGPGFAPLFRSYGVQEEKIIVTGAPEHDDFVEFPEKHSVEQSKAVFGVKGTACSLFLQPFLKKWGDMYANELRSICTIVTEHGNVDTILIKAHPKEPGENYKFLAEEFPKVLVTDVSGAEINGHVFNASEYMITRTSTVGFQAAGAKRFLITYHPSAEQENSTDDFAEINAPFHATSWERLTELIATAADLAARNRLVQSQRERLAPYVSLDGKACARIVSEVSSLV